LYNIQGPKKYQVFEKNSNPKMALKEILRRD